MPPLEVKTPHNWPKRVSSLAKCVSCLLVRLVGSGGLRSTLLLSLEWMTSLPSRALVGVEMTCARTSHPPLALLSAALQTLPPALPWLCDPARSQLESREGAVGALVTRLCPVSGCAVSGRAASALFLSSCPWSAKSAQGEETLPPPELGKGAS